ncbi:hypothetical protein HUS91_28505, partial [Pseudomonas chlororaphis]|uniref:hypothetical protein n=2 Tax=Pseudomonas TaxID=286 RepID=UPI001B3276ED
GVLNTEKQLDELRIEAQRKEFLTVTAEREARVAQELAIAERISTALEVTIEEFYEYKGEGELGLKTNGNVGFSASGQRVAKRVYTFKGLLPITNSAEDA